MTRTNDAAPAPDTLTPAARALAPPLTPHPPASTTAAPRVLVVDADRALFGLIEEWLNAEGCVVVAQGGAGSLAAESFDSMGRKFNGLFGDVKNVGGPKRVSQRVGLADMLACIADFVPPRKYSQEVDVPREAANLS